MPYNAEEGNVAYVVAHQQCTHGDPVADNGFVGTAVKTAIPAADAPRANRNIIAAGEGYTMLINRIVEVPVTNLAGILKGAMVYIRTTDNVIGNAPGMNFVPLGRVVSLPGERGTPSTMVRVNLRLKV